MVTEQRGKDLETACLGLICSKESQSAHLLGILGHFSSLRLADVQIVRDDILLQPARNRYGCCTPIYSGVTMIFSAECAFVRTATPHHQLRTESRLRRVFLTTIIIVNYLLSQSAKKTQRLLHTIKEQPWRQDQCLLPEAGRLGPERSHISSNKEKS